VALVSQGRSSQHLLQDKIHSLLRHISCSRHCEKTASEQVRMCSSSNNSGDGASAFSALLANNNSAIVETVQEGDSDDGQEDVDLGDNA